MGTLKKKMLISIIIVILLILGIAFSIHRILSTNGMTLTAEDIVAVYATEKEAMTWPHPDAMATLSSSQSVPVTKCVDVKSYMIIEIRLPDGRSGFVLEGKYKLMRDGKQTVCN